MSNLFRCFGCCWPNKPSSPAAASKLSGAPLNSPNLVGGSERRYSMRRKSSSRHRNNWNGNGDGDDNDDEEDRDEDDHRVEREMSLASMDRKSIGERKKSFSKKSRNNDDPESLEDGKSRNGDEEDRKHRHHRHRHHHHKHRKSHRHNSESEGKTETDADNNNDEVHDDEAEEDGHRDEHEGEDKKHRKHKHKHRHKGKTEDGERNNDNEHDLDDDKTNGRDSDEISSAAMRAAAKFGMSAPKGGILLSDDATVDQKRDRMVSSASVFGDGDEREDLGEDGHKHNKQRRSSVSSHSTSASVEDKSKKSSKKKSHRDRSHNELFSPTLPSATANPRSMSRRGSLKGSPIINLDIKTPRSMSSVSLLSPKGGMSMNMKSSLMSIKGLVTPRHFANTGSGGLITPKGTTSMSLITPGSASTAIGRSLKTPGVANDRESLALRRGYSISSAAASIGMLRKGSSKDLFQGVVNPGMATSTNAANAGSEWAISQFMQGIIDDSENAKSPTSQQQNNPFGPATARKTPTNTSSNMKRKDRFVGDDLVTPSVGPGQRRGSLSHQASVVGKLIRQRSSGASPSAMDVDKIRGLISPSARSRTGQGGKGAGFDVSMTISTGRSSKRRLIPPGTPPVRVSFTGVDGFSSPPLPLDKTVDSKYELFQRGSIDEFHLTIPGEDGLAELARVDILLNSGDPQHAYDMWFVENIVVRYVPEGGVMEQEYFVPCRRWLDGSTNVSLFPGREVVYRVAVSTSYRIDLDQETMPVSPASPLMELPDGTMAPKTRNSFRLELDIVGDKGSTGFHNLVQPLVAHTMPFRAKSLDVFEIVTHQEIGNIQMLRIQLPECPVSWFVHSIKAFQCKGSQIDEDNATVFFVGQWIHLMSDGQYLELDPNPGYSYKIQIISQRASEALCQAFLTLELFGELGASGEQVLHVDVAEFQKNSGQSHELLFTITAPGNLGDIERVHFLQKNCSKPWHLDRIQVRAAEEIFSWRNFVFPCNRLLEAEDLAFTLDVLYDKKQYEVAIVNADIRYKSKLSFTSGEDAKLFIEIYGKKACSGRLELGKPSNHPMTQFRPGETDVYLVQTNRDLGEVERIIVRYQPDGQDSVWQLDSVIVVSPIESSMAGRKWCFPCNRWLDSLVGSVQLLAGEEVDLTRYRIEVQVGNLKPACHGTSGSPYLCIKGQKGSSGQTLLFDPAVSLLGMSLRGLAGQGGRLLPDTTETHCVWCRDVGTLESVTFGVAGDPRLSLLVERVVVTDTDDRDIVFLGGSLLTATAPELEMFTGEVKEYKVSVITGDMKNAGTDSNVFVRLVGEKNISPICPLKECLEGKWRDKFERNQTDTFLIRSYDLGKLIKCVVSHDASGPGSGWYLDSIAVMDWEEEPTTYKFPACRWLSNDVREVELMEGRGYKYVIRIYTGEVKFASWDTEVYCDIIGEHGRTGHFLLNDSIERRREKFEKNQVTSFYVTAGRDLGELKQLLLGHNNVKGGNSGWFVDHAIVENVQGNFTKFPCKKWFSSQIMELQLIPGEETIYTVAVHTGNAPMAGTDANVHFEIFGSKGRSMKTVLTGSLEQRWDLFQRNQVDTFEVIAPCDLGDLFEIVIGHDGTAASSAWYLKGVVVTPPSGIAVTFPCERWLDPRLNTTQLQLHAGAFVTYQVEIKTSETNKTASLMNSFRCRAHITLLGVDGGSGRRVLTETVDGGKPQFKTGCSDTFKLSLSDDLGKIMQVVLGNDNFGFGFKWLVESVSVQGPVGTQMFRCHKWIGGDVVAIVMTESSSEIITSDKASSMFGWSKEGASALERAKSMLF